ncbi:Bug family tripartite tricarboxylate transporter substrate binding protein [Bordetella petrii]|uniref:Bug family tripartite tricarboxylate transporter substrate binding protein n=1 Tax=Bordetella petrii TaxID=94624 RepID=UPI001E5CB935|nr:tripartite tricarboxylate transporter substrate binding protein [Bordetella petrii]MCD0501776.1 tripartite tricarboxylate transporter substrate binding protein [Bordetella petrii]
MNATLRSLMTWAACAAATFGWPADAQQWAPKHSVEYVVPAGPGAALDTAARELQRLLEKQKILDQTLVITNKPGGSGAVGLQTLRAHEGDAHWVGTFSTGMISARVLHPDALSYAEMTPIALLLEESMLVAVRADSPFKNVHDLVAQLKKQPDSLTIAIATSVGNHIHLAIAKPLKKAGVDITKLVIVPYKSSGESMTALLGGHVDVVSASSPNVLSQYKAGTIRLLAATTAERLPGQLSDVPTWKEQGIDAVSTSVQGVLGPRNMTPSQLQYWESALAKVTASEEWNEFLKTQLWRPRFARHEDMQKVLDAEYASTRELLVDLKLAKP